MLMLKGTMFGIVAIEDSPVLKCGICGEGEFFDLGLEAVMSWATNHRQTAHQERWPRPRNEYWWRR